MYYKIIYSYTFTTYICSWRYLKKCIGIMINTYLLRVSKKKTSKPWLIDKALSKKKHEMIISSIKMNIIGKKNLPFFISNNSYFPSLFFINSFFILFKFKHILWWFIKIVDIKIGSLNTTSIYKIVSSIKKVEQIYNIYQINKKV